MMVELMADSTVELKVVRKVVTREILSVAQLVEWRVAH